MSELRIAGGATDEEVAAVLFALAQAGAAQPGVAATGVGTRRIPNRVPAPTHRSPLSWTARPR